MGDPGDTEMNQIWAWPCRACPPDEEEGWGERQVGWADRKDNGGEEMKKQGNVLRTWPRSGDIKRKGKCLVPGRLGMWVLGGRVMKKGVG